MKKTLKGKNVFCIAAASNSLKVMKKLLESPRINTKDALESRNEWDETCLHVAIVAGNYEMVKVCGFNLIMIFLVITILDILLLFYSYKKRCF